MSIALVRWGGSSTAALIHSNYISRYRNIPAALRTAARPAATSHPTLSSTASYAATVECSLRTQ